MKILNEKIKAAQGFQLFNFKCKYPGPFWIKIIKQNIIMKNNNSERPRKDQLVIYWIKSYIL